jgi:hypothetical protein
MHRDAFARRFGGARQPVSIFEPLESRRMFSGDGRGGPDPIEPDNYEPNNTFTAAANLGTTNTLDIGGLTIHIGTDVDYYKFTAAANGSVGVRIDFRHLTANLQLAAYNAQQQQIAFSNTSTAQNGSESFALNLTAGQLYYIRVTTTAGAVTNDYSLSMLPLSASFNWTMPPRFGNQLDQWGLPIMPNSSDYAQPNMAQIGTAVLPQFPVRFNGNGTFLGAPSTTYNWHIDGLAHNNGAVVRDLTGGPVIDTNLPNGQYTVTLTAIGSNGVQLSTSQSVKVVNYLIVAMGDSYISGEGNPHLPQQYDFLGFATSGAKWAQGLDDAVTASHRRAHRSGYAGVVQSALDLENSDPHSSVTFVSVAHSGATIEHGINGPQDSIDAGEWGSDPSQIHQLESIIGYRAIDALVLSIGGNDAGFADIAGSLVQLEPGSPNYQANLDALWQDAATRRSNLVNNLLPELDDALAAAHFWKGQVYLAEYPDPTHDATGGTAQKILDDISGGLEVDQNELNLVRANVLAPLAKEMAKFARDQGWEYVSDISSAFNTHGYGDWFRTATDSVVMQGPLNNRFVISSDDKAATTGTLHPIGDGLQVYRNRINSAFNQPNLMTLDLDIGPDTFSSQQGNFQLTIKNTSLFATAAPSVARFYLSNDANVNTSDIPVFDFNIPAIEPGDVRTFYGTLPVMTDPFRNGNNLDWVGVQLDANNQVAESVESDNLPIGGRDQASVAPELNLTQGPGGGLEWVGISFNQGTVTSKLGLDEFIGEYDIDAFKFEALSGQRLAFDLDSINPTNLDTYVRVYPMVGNVIDTSRLIGENNDGRAPDEPQAQNGESYLVCTLPQTGNYAVVISHANNYNGDPMSIWNRTAGGMGSYSLTIGQADTTAPTVTSAQFDWGGTSQKLKFTFSENVLPSLSPTDLVLTNTTTGQLVPSSSISLSYDGATNTATFSFASILADGNYRATLPAGSVTDPAGNPMFPAYNHDFFVLAGDANHDRTVNLQDFNVLATFFGQTSRTFSQGDFNYDGTVNLSDFNILAGRFGRSIGPSTFGGSTITGQQQSRLLDALRNELLA